MRETGLNYVFMQTAISDLDKTIFQSLEDKGRFVTFFVPVYPWILVRTLIHNRGIIFVFLRRVYNQALLPV